MGFFESLREFLGVCWGWGGGGGVEWVRGNLEEFVRGLKGLRRTEILGEFKGGGGLGRDLGNERKKKEKKTKRRK